MREAVIDCGSKKPFAILSGTNVKQACCAKYESRHSHAGSGDKCLNHSSNGVSEEYKKYVIVLYTL